MGKAKAPILLGRGLALVVRTQLCDFTASSLAAQRINAECCPVRRESPFELAREVRL